MLFSNLRGNCVISHLTKGISNCFPCGKFGILKPATQHLVLATYIIPMVVLLNCFKFMSFYSQLHFKQMPIHDRVQLIREVFQSGRGWSCWWRNDQVVVSHGIATQYSGDIFLRISKELIFTKLTFHNSVCGSWCFRHLCCCCSCRRNAADEIHEPSRCR